MADQTIENFEGYLSLFALEDAALLFLLCAPITLIERLAAAAVQMDGGTLRQRASLFQTDK